MRHKIAIAARDTHARCAWPGLLIFLPEPAAVFVLGWLNAKRSQLSTCHVRPELRGATQAAFLDAVLQFLHKITFSTSPPFAFCLLPLLPPFPPVFLMKHFNGGLVPFNQKPVEVPPTCSVHPQALDCVLVWAAGGCKAT